LIHCVSSVNPFFVFSVELVLNKPFLHLATRPLSRLCSNATFPSPAHRSTLTAEMSKNVLMNEYKALAKEKWVEIEVLHSLSEES